MKVSFPGFKINNLEIPKVAVKIGSFEIYWYAIIITIGIILAFIYALKNCKKFKLSQDNIYDALLWGLPCSVIGARIFYVAFSLREFNSFGELFNIRNGGLAIFGGIIGAFLTGVVLSKIKKINFLCLLDVASVGFLLGQCIGRWGNFFNGEVYGVTTSLPWRMIISGEPSTMHGVHPLFLYESLWNLLGFILINLFINKSKKRFNGQVALMYAIWYGTGRGMLEGLRQPEFILKGLFGGNVSQILAFACAIVAAIILIVMLKKNKAKGNYVKVFDTKSAVTELENEAICSQEQEATENNTEKEE